MIRRFELTDLDSLVALSERKRLDYQAFQPVFWRKAADSAEKQRLFLADFLKRETVIGLVFEGVEGIDGFIIGNLISAPPVYQPGGLTCSVDDFVVAEQAWDTVGVTLLAALAHQARLRGTAQMVVVSAQLDVAKRQMLSAEDYSVASECWVRPLTAFSPSSS